MTDLLLALWLFLPAALANAAPVFGNKVPRWNSWQTPLDFGHSYRGKRIFGKNKTWRGVASAVILAALVGLVQSRLQFHPYGWVTSIIVASLLGFGAIYGDAVESFFKRQYGVKAGKSWFPFDQIDYIIGGLVIAAPLMLFSWAEMGLILVAYFGLHLLGAYLGYHLKLKDRPL
jgi:CDP-2,3-bis-(O-geranylgeranyl)-sn-glycerol synthase